MNYLVLIEPKRSIIKAHTTTEYKFCVEDVTKETIEKCIKETGVEMVGMVGVSIVPLMKSEDFFVTVDNGKLQDWK